MTHINGRLLVWENANFSFLYLLTASGLASLRGELLPV
jgi:hypothetical protein